MDPGLQTHLIWLSFVPQQSTQNALCALSIMQSPMAHNPVSIKAGGMQEKKSPTQISWKEHGSHTVALKIFFWSASSSLPQPSRRSERRMWRQAKSQRKWRVAVAQAAELIFDNGSFVLLMPIHFVPLTHLSPSQTVQRCTKVTLNLDALMHIKQKEIVREVKPMTVWQEQETMWQSLWKLVLLIVLLLWKVF